MNTVKAYPNALVDLLPQGTLRYSTDNNLPSVSRPTSTLTETPIGSTTGSPFFPTSASIYGVGSFDIADLDPTRGDYPVAALTQVSIDTTSSALNLGADGVQLGIVFQHSNTTCDIKLYAVENNVDVLRKEWTVLTPADGDGLFCGHADSIKLQGNNVKVRALNITNGWVTVSVTPTS